MVDTCHLPTHAPALGVELLVLRCHELDMLLVGSLFQLIKVRPIYDFLVLNGLLLLLLHMLDFARHFLDAGGQLAVDFEVSPAFGSGRVKLIIHLLIY